MQPEIRLPLLSDMHVHLRDGHMLEAVAPMTSRCCQYALVMPNLTPPVWDAETLKAYTERVAAAVPHGWFRPKFSIKLLPKTTPEVIDAAAKAGAVAAKIYPEGVTTNSHDGLSTDYFYPTKGDYWDAIIPALVENNMLLLIHGEHPDSEVLDREQDFIETAFVKRMLKRHRGLKAVLEHITTKYAVEAVRDLWDRSDGRCAATITLHHLRMTLDDVIGGMLQPHNFCKPVAKFKRDREALVEAGISGEACFFLGSDSAPHAQSAKENACGCAGCYTAPVLPELLAQTFEDYGCLRRLRDFGSYFGADYYGLEQTKKEIVLQPGHIDDRVPPAYVGKSFNVVPWYANGSLRYRLAGVV